MPAFDIDRSQRGGKTHLQLFNYKYNSTRTATMLLVRHYMHQIRAEIKPTMNDLKSASQNIDPHHDIIYIAPDSGATAPPVKIAEIYDREEIGKR